MIIRNLEGEIVILNKNHFKNDKLYYSKIMNIISEYKNINDNKNILINNTKVNNYSNNFLKTVTNNIKINNENM